MMEMDSFAGKFLLAAPKLVDPHFVRTVVLIVRHDEEGAFGFIVNRPLHVDIASALGDTIEAARESTNPVYSGGPCQGPVFVMHTDPTIGGEQPVEGIFVTTDREGIEKLLIEQAEPIKLFSSYSGWAAGQIENELSVGGWVVTTPTADEIFGSDPHLWSRLISRVNLSKYVDPTRIPDDPSVN